ncbi:MAG: hypothetical protein ACM3X9_09400 [Bacillota bacterium]
MPILRNEFDKTINRLRLIQSELQEKGLPKTAEMLSEVIIQLGKTDSIYIQELAANKATASKKKNSD